MPAGPGQLGDQVLQRGRIVRDTGRLPAQLGWYLLAIGVPLQILYPVSGAPGLIALGVLALIVTWRDSAGGGPSGTLSAREGRDAERRADQEDREQSAGVAESDRPATAASEA
ncbi:hypothetical protein [Streptomyces peucetius]|uniref:Uncharacterized protein n=1 Tax=Streptomyces peucetius TaxID=1950 RepID=A0ABY6I6C7_STRPE|nr:hypothetical protein [Streptomyces peucetius]UYQ62289.1 hypothetical protein OGH68_12905 [Streptomyces peucetius]